MGTQKKNKNGKGIDIKKELYANLLKKYGFNKRGSRILSGDVLQKLYNIIKGG